MMNLCVFSGTKNLGCPFASSLETAAGLEAKAMSELVVSPDRDPFAFDWESDYGTAQQPARPGVGRTRLNAIIRAVKSKTFPGDSLLRRVLSPTSTWPLHKNCPTS